MARGSMQSNDKNQSPEEKSELLTQDEITVALLLLEGKTRSEITRSLHLTSIEADMRLAGIRSKIGLLSDSDPVIAAAITEYKLTRRETDVLRYLRRGMINSEIATELYLSEGTVKIHVRNLFRKLQINTRKDLASWEEAIVKKFDLRLTRS